MSDETIKRVNEGDGREIRVIRGAGIRTRQEDDDQVVISGLGAVYGQVSEIAPGHYEMIEPGALTPAEGVKCLYNHKKDELLGTQENGTLELSDTSAGLEYRVRPNMDTTFGQNTAALVGRRDITGSSIGFTDPAVEQREIGDRVVNVITDVRELVDVGPVTFEAYSGTSVGLRSAYGFDDDESCGCKKTETRGEALGELMMDWEDEVIDSAMGPNTKDDLREELGSEAGISASTVASISSGEIACPPIDRLRAFARVFARYLDGEPSDKLDDLVAEAEEDGCEFDDQRDKERLKRVIRLQKLRG